MCGLIALRGFRMEQGKDLARRGLAAIAHRGPDGEGLYVDDGAMPTILGHRRLSILDLTAAGSQPMICRETGNVLVYNGEIYNFLELRELLEARGERFESDGDTEVILAGWRIWGPEFFARCNGMWALVLLERRSGDMIACRDRLGVKPLYVHRDRGAVMLASEIRAIARMRGGYPAPNPTAIFDFLTLGLSDHTPQTFFESIEAVPPGQAIRFNRDGGTTAHAYHRWPGLGERPALEPAEVHGLLKDATLLRLRSDVPTVSLLSGGLDSSILTALSLQATGLPRIDFAGAFTYGYTDAAQADVDETTQAAVLMHELGHPARHHVRRLAALPSDTELLDLVATQEEPFCTPSILASFRTYRALSADGCKVVLSGEGADETFGGYIRLYQALAARDALRSGRVGSALLRLGRGVVRPSLLLNRLAWDLPLRVLANRLRGHRPSVALMSGELWHGHSRRLAALAQDRRVTLDERMRRDVITTNLPMVLRMTDRNAMRFGVEVRSPFLDYRLVERALATPAALRMGNDHGKVLLRQAFGGEVPDRVLWRRKTTGFGHAEQFLVPQMPLTCLLDDLPASLQDYLDVPRLRRDLRRRSLHPTVWLAVSVALWYRTVYG